MSRPGSGAGDRAKRRMKRNRRKKLRKWQDAPYRSEEVREKPRKGIPEPTVLRRMVNVLTWIGIGAAGAALVSAVRFVSR